MKQAYDNEMLVPWRARAWLVALVVVTLLFLILPVFIVLPMSFSGERYLRFPPQSWSLRWYEAFIADPAWREAIVTSLITACATTVISVPLGTAAAYAVNALSGRWLRLVQLLILTPVMVPNIVIAVAVFFVFARLELIGTLTGLTLAHVMLALPFVFIAVLSGLRGQDMNQELVARSLGMNRWRAFLAVTLPQIRPSVLAAALLAFITSLDEVVVAMFVSTGRPTLTKSMFASVREEIDPTIAAISSVLIVVTLSLFLLQTLLRRQK